MSQFRHTTKKNSTIPPLRHTIVSNGNEKIVLRGLFYSDKKRFNVRDFSNRNGIARTTTRDTLNTLINKGYVNKISMGVYVITETGKQIFQSLNDVADSSVGSGGQANFSTHYLKYTAKIESKDTNWRLKVETLKPNTIKDLNNKNNPQTYLYFNDSTVIICKNKIIIRIHDIISNDSEEALFKSFNQALERFTELKKIGLHTESMILEDSHFAQMNTYLGEQLDKINNRYYVELEDKTKFWIDRSHGNPELETNNKQLQENIDTFIKYEADNDLTDDFKKLKDILTDAIKTINLQGKHNEVTAYGLSAITEYLKEQIPKKIKEPQKQPTPRYIY